MTEVKEKIVSKGTEEFKKSKASYLELFTKNNLEETITSGIMGIKAIQTEKVKEIPKPFSCPDLELYVWDSGAVAFFCGRIGCLCSCCREDLEGEYPTYCPDPEEFLYDDYDDEAYYDDEWEDDW